jgi:hypothetical protein
MSLTSGSDKSIGVALPASTLSNSVDMGYRTGQVVVDNHSTLGMAFDASRTSKIVAGLDPNSCRPRSAREKGIVDLHTEYSHVGFDVRAIVQVKPCKELGPAVRLDLVRRLWINLVSSYGPVHKTHNLLRGDGGDVDPSQDAHAHAFDLAQHHLARLAVELTGERISLPVDNRHVGDGWPAIKNESIR